jgi:hypothetical protein
LDERNVSDLPDMVDGYGSEFAAAATLLVERFRPKHSGANCCHHIKNKKPSQGRESAFGHYHFTSYTLLLSFFHTTHLAQNTSFIRPPIEYQHYICTFWILKLRSMSFFLTRRIAVEMYGAVEDSKIGFSLEALFDEGFVVGCSVMY